MTRKFDTRSLIVLMSAVCLTAVASAQTRWWKTFGGTDGDVGYSVQQTTDGGYIIAGATNSFGPGTPDSSNVYLIKTDAAGDTLWTKTYGGTGNDYGNFVRQTSDGGFIIAGGTSSFNAGKGDVYLIKTNALGDTIWTRTYGGTDLDQGCSVQPTIDSGYIIAGYTSSYGAGNSDFYLVRTNASGDTLWTRTYGGIGNEWGYNVQTTTDGGYIVAGSTDSYGAGDGDFYLVKTDGSGDTLWTRTYGGAGFDEANSVQQTADGGYIVTGYTYSFSVAHDAVYLVRTDSPGDTLWTRTIDGTAYESGRSVQQTHDGGYIIVGITSSFGAGKTAVYLIKANAPGDTLWTRTYGGTDLDQGFSVQQTVDGGYIIAGFTNSLGAGSYDVYLIKTDSLGNVGVAEESPKPQATSRKPAATVVRNLPEPAVAFDAMGRRVLHPKPGIYFLRTAAAAQPRKVLLVE